MNNYPVPAPVNYGNIKEIQMVQFEVDEICNQIKNMPTNGLMVEWGSGGSTCKWLDTLQGNQKLISIEHNFDWYNKVGMNVGNCFSDEKKSNFKYHYVPEEPYFKHGYGGLEEEHPIGTTKYINPNNEIWDADIYLIDGIARATCALTLLAFNRNKNPVIYIHDYVGREIWYDWVTQFFNKETYTEKNRFSTLCRLYLK